MKYWSIYLSFFLIVGCQKLTCTSVYTGDSFKGFHTRGLSLNNNKVVVSGSKGVYGIYNLELNKWELRDNVFGIEDFRDAEFLNDSTIVLLNSGTDGLIYKNWTKVFSKENLFLDGLSFYDDNSTTGFAYGDPIDSVFSVFKTINFGQTWTQISQESLPKILKDEAGFAASGTGIQTPELNVVYIGTGVSDTSRILRSFNNGRTWDAISTPMKSGDDFGIYSMNFGSANNGFIVGGSYKDTLYNDKICFYTSNKGVKWQNRSEGLPGYMSCIASNNSMKLVVVTGRLGTYYSINKGRKWEKLSSTPYYSCVLNESKIILAGKNGRFQVYNYKL